MTRLCLFLVLVFVATTALAQNQLITKENVSIPCRITSVSPELIRYVNKYNDLADSIETQNLSEMRYGDTLRVLIVPMQKKGESLPISPTNFLAALEQGDYVTLLHSRTSLLNLRFIANRTVLVLTQPSQAALTPWAAALKAKPGLTTEMTVHTDTVGKAAANLALSERQAAVIGRFLATSQVPATSFSVKGVGEQASLSARPEERRVELRCTRIRGIDVLYAKKYIRTEQPKPTTPTPSTIRPDNPTVQTNQYIAPKKKKPIGFILFGEGLYALESSSKTWVDPNQGIGILQGFGGGAQVTYYLSSRFGVSLQGSYEIWKVQRRYMTEEGQVVYTNDQDLQRIGVQVGLRLYALPSVYLQPMGGGQLTKLISQNSATHPNGALKTEMSKFMPTFGGALGFEIGKKGLVIDIAAQYMISSNTDFAGATSPLHYAGLRAGIGFRPRTR